MRAAKTQTTVRQEQIAQSALKLIAQHGFHQLSMTMLAEDVGVVSSDIYRHYKGKDDVLDAVLDLISKKMLQNVEVARCETLNSLGRLHALLMSHVQLVQSGVPIPRVVFSEEIFTGDKKRRSRVHQIFNQYLQKIAGLIQEGQLAGEIRPELAPDTLSMMYLGLVQPALILWLMEEGAFDLEQRVEDAWRIFHKMISNKPINQKIKNPRL